MAWEEIKGRGKGVFILGLRVKTFQIVPFPDFNEQGILIQSFSLHFCPPVTGFFILKDTNLQTFYPALHEPSGKRSASFGEDCSE